MNPARLGPQPPPRFADGAGAWRFSTQERSPKDAKQFMDCSAVSMNRFESLGVPVEFMEPEPAHGSKSSLCRKPAKWPDARTNANRCSIRFVSLRTTILRTPDVVENQRPKRHG
jgi:hypothetical protein